MTNEQIAKWCGWKHRSRGPDGPASSFGPVWISPDGAMRALPPDFDTDLNACVEFERKIEYRGWAMKYSAALVDVRPNIYPGDCRDWWVAVGWSATAKQRCEALAVVVEKGEADRG